MSNEEEQSNQRVELSVKDSTNVVQVGIAHGDVHIEMPDADRAAIDRYLKGRLEDFQREHELFVALAGETAIESRFDRYADAFEPDRPPEPVETLDDITQVVDRQNRFALLGDPGAGKSTTMRWLAKSSVDAWFAGNGAQRFPLWINLGYGGNPTDALDLLRFWWKKYGLPSDDPEPYLNNNALTLYLDGLNEVPELGERRKTLAKSLRAFLAEYADTPAIVTCRVRDYDDVLNLGLPVVRIQPLDEARSRQFVEKRGAGDLWARVADDTPLRRIRIGPCTQP